ncbi:hypothetical protein H0H92_003076 [Tricholoma furcatifolium]|nr:hypothetical protein H0H92_003076 [Tricholoma furcatifolium]
MSGKSLVSTVCAPSASGSGSGSGQPPTKAIGSLAKKQGDVTRQGAQKLKFVPTLPARRKKEEVKQEPTAPVVPATPAANERGRGRGAGRGGDRGRGRGRAAGPPVVEMTASGPFAMGPALAGNTATRRSTPRSNFAAIPTSGSAQLGSTLVKGAAPTLKRVGATKTEAKEDDDAEVYSDPDEGVEIVDMEDVRQMDWMAPESLRKERQKKKIKKEKTSQNAGGAIPEVDLANALNLSESEEEEELEDIIEHFAAASAEAQQVNFVCKSCEQKLTMTPPQDPDLREERLYFFQFPSPFPTFVSPNAESSSSDQDVLMADDATDKKVASATNVKTEAGSATSKAPTVEPEAASPRIDGVIGRLEVYRSGAVKMRLANGILLDVTSATQPSFLQQAVRLDREKKSLIVLGEVNKRFSVSPDVEALLAAMETADQKPPPMLLDDSNLIQMDMA